MYNKIKDYFGFKKIPFSKQIGTGELFLSRQIKEAYTRLEFALLNEDITLLSGSVGCGKTTALRYFESNIDPNYYKIVYISADKYKFGEISKYALAGLNMEVPYSTNRAIRMLKQAIETLNKDKRIKPILIIDEVQELEVDTLKQLKNMVNFDMDSQNRLLLILCGQKEFLSTLSLESLSSLKRRIRINYQMQELTLEETKEYIKHQLKITGIQRPMFPDDVISEIFSMSKGNVCEVNRLCFNMINIAAYQSKEIMELSMLEHAFQF